MTDSRELKRRKPLVLEVRDELERMILGGEVPAGERLNEQILADLMGVSRAPVREAARSLEKDGLVTTVANKGVFVRKLTLEDALELYEMRAMVFGYLCARAAANSDDETRANLRASIARMDDAAAREDESGYFYENLAFHDLIGAAASSSRVAAIYAGLCKEVGLMRARVLTGPRSLAISNEEHKNIVREIERGDVKAASRAGRAHHLNGKQRLLGTYCTAKNDKT